MESAARCCIHIEGQRGRHPCSSHDHVLTNVKRPDAGYVRHPSCDFWKKIRKLFPDVPPHLVIHWHSPVPEGVSATEPTLCIVRWSKPRHGCYVMCGENRVVSPTPPSKSARVTGISTPQLRSGRTWDVEAVESSSQSNTGRNDPPLPKHEGGRSATEGCQTRIGVTCVYCVARMVYGGNTDMAR
jgi:hypothetical protein